MTRGGAGWRAVSTALFVLAGVALATVSAWPIYEHPRMLVIAAVGGLAGVGLGVVSTLLHWRWWLTLPLVVVGYLAISLVWGVSGALSSPGAAIRGARDAILGIVLGWKQLVTLDPPLGDYQTVLVPWCVVVFLGAFAASSFGCRPSRVGLLAPVIVVAMVAFGAAFGAVDASPGLPVAGFDSLGGRSLLLGLVTVLLCIGWLVVRARLERAAALARAAGFATGVEKRSGSRWAALRSNALGVALVAIAAIAGVLLAPAVVSSSARTTLREAVDPMIVISRMESPLADYRSWFAGDRYDAPLFTVSGVPDGVDRVRLVTMSDFDGTRFLVDASASGRFVRLPNPLRAEGAVPVTIQVEDGYDSPWLPLAGELTSAPEFLGPRATALADGLYAAPGGASAIVVSGDAALRVRSGDSYRVWAAPAPTTDRLASSRGGDVRMDPDRFPELTAWVDGGELPRTGAGVLEAVTRLRERGYLSHARTDDASSQGWISALEGRTDYRFEPSLAGHSTARIEELFRSLNDQARKAGPDAPDQLLVAAVGDDEQFAAAAALVARYLGFDSRVVLGVLLASDEALPAVAPCAADGCTGANVTAWVEVRDSSGAWVPLDVSPQYSQDIQRVTLSEVPPEQPTVPDDPMGEVLDPPSSTNTDTGQQDAPDAAQAAVPEALRRIITAVATILFALAMFALPVVALLVVKSVLRRRRRREPVPEVAIVAAWEELIDSYIDAGIDRGVGGSRREVAEALERPAALRLAELADTAVFAEHPPLRPQSEDAWAIVDAERAELRAAAPPFQRIKTALSLESFLRRLDPNRHASVTRRATRKGSAS